MANYINEHEFGSLRERLAKGSAQLTIPRQVARQFFTHVSSSSVRLTTGHSLFAQQTCIWALIAATGVLLVLGLVVIVYFFGWASTIAAPVAGIFWTIIVGLTGSRGSWLHGLAGLITGLALAFIIPVEFGLPLALLAVSIFLHRTSFLLAEIWVTGLVSRSWHAYDMLVEHIVVTDGV